MFPSKNVNFCLFYASKQAKVQKKLLDVYLISHGHSKFAHIQVGGLGGSWGGGKAAIATVPPHQDLCDTHRNRRKSAR